MDCPKCKIELKQGDKVKEPDGTEYFEMKCYRCGERFADIKISCSAISGYEPSPEELIDQLVKSKININMDLVNKIISNRKIIPLLIDLLGSQKLIEKSDYWADINALHLLSIMKAQEAVPHILHILKTRPDSLGDWLTEDIPPILANFGPEQIDTYKKLWMRVRTLIVLQGIVSQGLWLQSRERTLTSPYIHGLKTIWNTF